MEKLTMRQILSLTLTLFAVFFGAGNMIFPPAMGRLAGNDLQALAGFILTDAGIALLGMIAVVLVGEQNYGPWGFCEPEVFFAFIRNGVFADRAAFCAAANRKRIV